MNLNRNIGGRIKPFRAAPIVILTRIMALMSMRGVARAASPNPVVATVGTYRIMQEEVDHAVLQTVSPSHSMTCARTRSIG